LFQPSSSRRAFFIGKTHNAEEAFQMGMVNAVVPHAELDDFALEWGAEINKKSPTAMKMLKYGFNLPDDGMVGQQLFAARSACGGRRQSVGAVSSGRCRVFHDKQVELMANGNTFQARQGDILLIETRAPIERALGQATEVNREHGVLVIAVGESSGHRHQVAAMGARLFSQNSGATLLEVTEPGGALIEVTSDRGEPLAHVRHHPVVLRGGLYEIRRKRVWSGGRLRGVRD
jgi:hypothetical protein